jgi:hypothetical protein
LVTERVLMLVKTYPTPSQKYGEIVCTAGINIDTLEWRRVFPYPFRTIEEGSQFKKWDIVEIPLERSNQDKRPESRRLVDSRAIQTIAHIESGDKFWTPRIPYLRTGAATTVQEVLDELLSADKQVWGPTIRVVRAKPGTGVLESSYQGTVWDENDLVKLEKARQGIEQNMFAPPELVRNFRTLKRPPYKLRLRFSDQSGKEHSLLLLDWEFPWLLLKEITRLGSHEAALESVKKKVEQQIFASNRDPHLVLGSMNHDLKQRQLAVIGHFSPQQQDLDSLF